VGFGEAGGLEGGELNDQSTQERWAGGSTQGGSGNCDEVLEQRRVLGLGEVKLGQTYHKTIQQRKNNGRDVWVDNYKRFEGGDERKKKTMDPETVLKLTTGGAMKKKYIDLRQSEPALRFSLLRRKRRASNTRTPP